MKTFLSLVVFSLKENLKTKLYLVLFLFSIVLIFIGLLLTQLSGFEQPQRVLINTGIAMIELFCLVVVLLNSVGIFLQDLETKSIYLVLSKPISRTSYIIAKFIGLLLVTIINILIMSSIHVLLIKISKWNINIEYLLVLITIFLKVGIISSVSLLTSIAMTSQTVSVITSLLVWISGHFITELQFIIKKTQSIPLKMIFNSIIYLIPNFQYLNIKDFFDSPYFVSKFSIIFGILYWLVYSSSVLTISCVVFNKKNL